MRSLLLIHALLNTLKSLLHTLELICEACLIMIHAILHRVESSIADNSKLLHTSPNNRWMPNRSVWYFFSAMEWHVISGIG